MTALALAPAAPPADDAARTPPEPGDAMPWQACTRWHQAADGSTSAHSQLLLSGVHCAACSTTVEQLLGAVPGVLDVRASAAAARVSVHWDPARTDPARLCAAVRPGGYGLTPDEGASARELRRAEARGALWRTFVAALCSMQVMMLAAPSYTTQPGELEQHFAQILNWGQWVLALPVLLFSARPLFSSAGSSLRTRRMSMEVPVVLGLLVTFVASTVATFQPDGWFGHEVYFDSMTMFVALLLGARWLEMRVRHRAAEQLETGRDVLPDRAWRVVAEGAVEAVTLAALKLGDTVQVPMGEAVPADGELLNGEAWLDESLLSGESRPIPKQAGNPASHQLWAGSINRGAPLLMKITARAGDTRLAAIASLVADAQTQRPDSYRLADRWAGPFIVGVLVAAMAAGLAWWHIEPARAWSVAVAVLIVTCPCALSLAVPAAQLAAVQSLARRSVVVRRPGALERLAAATRVVFDKTGTLTRSGRERVTLRLLDSQASEPELWAHAAALATASTHPVSRAILAATSQTPAALERIKESPGQGLEGVDAEGMRWRLGSAQFVGVAAEGDGRVWLSRDDVALAAFAIEEPLRPDAVPTMADLQSLGLSVQLLSGDHPDRVGHMGRAVGIAMVEGGASPERKLAVVAEAQAQGEVVVMVGDGFNDSPVLARADVAVVMSHGAMASCREADLLLDGNRDDALQSLVAARTLAVRAHRVARQNLAWALAYNAACIPLALAGWLPPWAAGLGMATSSLLVVLNGARLTRG